MERPFPAYEGNEPYVFVCYAHEDQATVYAEITWLHEHGINVWYDEGISPGSEWSNAIADAIVGCATFVYFISPRSVDSEHCRRELSYALSHGIKVQAVHLGTTPIERGLELSLGNRQAIIKRELTETRYREKLLQALAPDGAAAVRLEIPRRVRFKRVAVGSAAALGLTLAGAWFYIKPAPETPATDQMDVFLRPVRDLSDPPAPRFADALTDEILTKLNTVPNWRTHLASTDHGDHPGIRVEPSVRVGEESVRLSVNVVENRSSEVLESFTTDDLKLSDADSQQRLAMLTGHITFQVVDMSNMRTESFERTGSHEAVDLLVAARKQTTRSSLDTEACSKAIRLDPKLAWGYTCLAQLLLLSNDAKQRELGLEMVAKARELAPERGEVWAAEAVLPLTRARNYAEAERLLIRARALNPFSIPTLNGLGWLYFMTGRLEQSLDVYRVLLPLTRASDPFIGVLVGYQDMVVAFTAGRYLELARELGFDSPFMPASRLAQAVAYAELDDARAEPLIDEFLLRWPNLGLRQRGGVVWALQLVGRTGEAAERYAQLIELVNNGAAFLPNDPQTWLSWELTHYAVVAGDFDGAFRWLELGKSNEMDLVLLVTSLAYTRNPRYARLREDPRFDVVLAEMRAPRTD